jgi:two-component system, OmpR family, phosphate regulon sensor histidine kinase PhoR
MTTILLIASIVLASTCAALAATIWRLHHGLRVERARTEQLRAALHHVEAAATRLERVRSDFVANISHELRTPLASIKLLVETLEAGALDDAASARTFTCKIGAETNHLIAMAEELLSLARLEALPAMQRGALDPATLVSQAIERMRELARQKEVSLCADLPPCLPHVWADEAQVGRVFVNLLTNALTFTPGGGRVVVSGRVEPDAVAFSVADTGPGIPRGEEKRIFERFYKADPARQRGGTGLGLSIAHHIVKAHSGHIWAQNRAEGGACFIFTLPVATRVGPES